MTVADPVLRITAASLLTLLYTALCIGVWLRERQRLLRTDQETAALAVGDGSNPWLIAYASQTGFAETLARETARMLHAASIPVHLCPLNAVDTAVLARSQQALFVVSTYGEGDAPDNAVLFQTHVMQGANTNLSHMRYGLLALGDSQYTHYCGFGRALDAWLQARGADVWLERIDMDNAAPQALAAWQQHVSHISGALVQALSNNDFTPWTLTERHHMNPGSAGGAVFHLALQSSSTAEWESGDLVQLRVPAAPENPREYSIASIPADGSLHLLVRQTRREDGTPGVASHWLTEQLSIGATVELRVRPHANFRLEGNAGHPLILIGNGTGIAGLRSHVRARAAAGITAHWLILGERNAAYDTLYGEELHALLETGRIQRLDWAFSRDSTQRIYVQDIIFQHADSVRQWVHEGAAIYVCGSLQGMAQGVHEALQAVLGTDHLEQLIRSGRYRRDVY